MVYFEINHLGFNCGKIKEKCSKYPKYCFECVKNKLKQLGLEVESEVNVVEIDSEKRRLKMEEQLIWRIFSDVLNIRHVIIIDKESGLTLLNYPVSGEEINADLLSGFIQANITFSESQKEPYRSSRSIGDKAFYEFQYQNFNILLRDGDYIRICLMLDNKASENIKNQVLHLIPDFEEKYNQEINNFRTAGMFYFKNMVDYIIDSFEIRLVFPMILTQSIAPNILQGINQNQIQKAIFNIAKEILVSKPFFFINNLLNRVKKIVNLDAHVILYQIYQLVENKTIIPTKLEVAVTNLERIQEAEDEKAEKYKPISSMIISDSDLADLKEKVEDMDENSAVNVIRELVRKGKNAEKVKAYQVAEKEYKKALFLAKELNLKIHIERISEILLELDKQVKQLELDFTLKAGENAEKSGDFINSIQHYQKALKILESFLIYNISDSRIKKIKRKIVKLREEL
ncbi:MAG: hypothetical protein ACFFDX_12520 [Candidatus Odinarchaeota archaeon]